MSLDPSFAPPGWTNFAPPLTGLVDSVKVAPSLDTNEGHAAANLNVGSPVGATDESDQGLVARRQWGIGKLGGDGGGVVDEAYAHRAAGDLDPTGRSGAGQGVGKWPLLEHFPS